MGSEPSGKAIAEYKELVKENANLKLVAQVTPEKYRMLLDATQEFINKVNPLTLKISVNENGYNNHQFCVDYKAKPTQLISVDSKQDTNEDEN